MKKLVRDKIPEVYPGRKYRKANEEEYSKELLLKLQEEVDEFKEDQNLEELADIIEVVHALAELKGHSAQDLEMIRKNKAEERGKFKDRIMFEGF